nr:reverse transcriptase domain-containing protein [Tanacetum cinerariifolium]
MSAMANTTPIVTTVTKAATKEKTPKEADAAPRVNILELCEEHYEEILPVIMDKIRLTSEKKSILGWTLEKVIGGRAHSSDLAILTRQAQLSLGRTWKTLGIILTVEVALKDGALLLVEIVLEAETVPAPSKIHMTARVWFDELPPESVDRYKDLKAAFLAYFMQQKKYVKYPVKIHNIKQRDGETIEDFIERFKRLNEHVPKTMEEMMTATIAFIRGETAAASKKKGHTSFTPLTRTPKEILAVEAGKFKPPPPMIKELVRAGKLSQLIKEIKQGRDHPKVGKKEVPNKDMSMAIYMGAEGPLVIEAEISGNMIHRMYVDGGSSTEKKKGQASERAKAIQAEMAESDEEKTAFHTSHGVYCYTKMPFGLKNAGATYQRQVDKAFDNQVGWNIEVYVNDLVIKSHTETEMLMDVDEMFRTLLKINMKLNLKKYTSRAMERMFLGYMIIPEGTKPCPNKTEAVLRLSFPRTIKEVQSLNGKLASLNKFLSKSTEKSLPLFKTLKKCIKKSDFHWTPEMEQAFKQLKQHLSKLPMLVAPKPKEELIVYMPASYGTISAVLMTERDKPRTSVKGQILANFLVKKSNEAPPNTSVVETPQEPWTLFMDGSSYVDGSGAGLILTSPKRTEFTYALRFQFTASNNEAEKIHTREGSDDSARGRWTNMDNTDNGIFERTIPDDRKGANKLRIKSRQYELLEGVLYKRSFLKPWLRCIGRLQADYVIREIHEGSCNMNAGPQPVVAKAMWKGQVFYRRYGLFYEVDRDESHGDNHRQSGEEVRVGQHSVSLRPSERNKDDIPVEIGMPTYRTAVVDVVYNDEELRLNLDLLEERRERAAIREAKAKLKMTKYYNAREGPYEVMKALGDGAYMLRSMNGTPQTWNIANLKICHL